MYIGIKHLHVLLVVLYIVFFLIKVILLMLPKKEPLRNFRHKTRWIEITLSVLFVATGIFLWINTGLTGVWLYVKIGVLILIIVAGIFAFKRESKILGIFSFIALLYVYGLSETKSPTFKDPLKTPPASREEIRLSEQADKMEMGKQLYTYYCVQCHGPEGNRGLSGAKDLSNNELSKNEIKVVIAHGRLTMPAYINVFTEEQMDAVAEYTKSLQTK